MKFGYSVRDITPQTPISMGGYMERKQKSIGIFDPIHVRTALFEDSKGEIVVLIIAELIEFTKKDAEQVKKKVEELTSINEERVILSVTHTHSGPLTSYLPVMGERDDTYMNWLKEVIAGTVVEALSDRQECKIGWYQTEYKGVGSNRRDPEKEAYTYLTILSIADMEERIIGAIFNYNCHPTVLSAENLKISADYPGATIKLLSKVYNNSFLAFTNGAAGDISTRFTRKDQSYKEMTRLGNLLAGEILKGLNNIEYENNPSLTVIGKTFGLIPRDLPDESELQNKIDKTKNQVESLKKRGANPGELRVAITALQGLMVQKVLKENFSSLEFEGYINAIRIGKGVIITVPGELFSTLGKKIMEGSPYNPTLILGYSNGSFGYIPDKKSYEEGGYESFSCRFKIGEGETLVNETLNLIKELEG